MFRNTGGLAFLVTALLAAMTLGCGRSASETAPAERTPGASKKEDNNPIDVYALVRAGATQMSGAIDSIAEALEQAKKGQGAATGEARQAFDEIVDRIDGVGAALADFSIDPPDRAQFEKRLVIEDERRLAAIQAANDGIHELKEASGIADSLVESAPPPLAQELKKLVGLLDLAVQDVSDALVAFGGVVEKEGES